MQFNENELETILSAVAFAASADVCWDISPEVKNKLLDIINRMTMNQVKVSQDLYVLEPGSYDYEQPEVTNILVSDAKMRVQKRKYI